MHRLRRNVLSMVGIAAITAPALAWSAIVTSTDAVSEGGTTTALTVTGGTLVNYEGDFQFGTGIGGYAQDLYDDQGLVIGTETGYELYDTYLALGTAAPAGPAGQARYPWTWGAPPLPNNPDLLRTVERAGFTSGSTHLSWLAYYNDLAAADLHNGFGNIPALQAQPNALFGGNDAVFLGRITTTGHSSTLSGEIAVFLGSELGVVLPVQSHDPFETGLQLAAVSTPVTLSDGSTTATTHDLYITGNPAPAPLAPTSNPVIQSLMAPFELGQLTLAPSTVGPTTTLEITLDAQACVFPLLRPSVRWEVVYERLPGPITESALFKWLPEDVQIVSSSCQLTCDLGDESQESAGSPLSLDCAGTLEGQMTVTNFDLDVSGTTDAVDVAVHLARVASADMSRADLDESGTITTADINLAVDAVTATHTGGVAQAIADVAVVYSSNCDSDGDFLSDGAEAFLEQIAGMPSLSADNTMSSSVHQPLVMSEIARLSVTDPNWADLDGDNIPAGMEALLGTSDADPDSDGDGLTDSEEVFATHGGLSRSHPAIADTDGDSASDGIEVSAQSVLLGARPDLPDSVVVVDMMLATDHDEDGVVSGVEQLNGTSPFSETSAEKESNLVEALAYENSHRLQIMSETIVSPLLTGHFVDLIIATKFGDSHHIYDENIRILVTDRSDETHAPVLQYPILLNDAIAGIPPVDYGRVAVVTSFHLWCREY
ncbi:MAG: hypothetical protein AAGI30_12795 [Planctomycetota bacterium]